MAKYTLTYSSKFKKDFKKYKKHFTSKIEELYKDLLASERDKITILNNALESLKNV